MNDEMLCSFCGAPMGDDPSDPGCCGETWGRAAMTRAEGDAQDLSDAQYDARRRQVAEAMAAPAPTEYACCGREVDPEAAYCPHCPEAEANWP